MKSKPISSFFDHFPAKVAEYCFHLWDEYQFKFIVSKSRHSKYGDYRFQPKVGHTITVNHNLNPYAFLVTYLHEVAHLLTFLTYKNKVQPHGIEWKKNFKELFDPLLDEDLLPKELIQVLTTYLKNPAASSASYAPLVEALKSYDPISQFILLKNLPENSAFWIKNLRLIKQKLNRTRYFCIDPITGKKYLVSKNANVLPEISET
ncbi:MAG: hypothetical protein RJA76_1541 [Bacteroidota bacterium]|jgi:hypothetical protein